MRFQPDAALLLTTSRGLSRARHIAIFALLNAATRDRRVVSA